MKLAIVLLMGTIGAAGCGDDIFTDYKADSDIAQCRRLTSNGAVIEKWEEVGYICHSNPAERQKPISQKLSEKFAAPPEHK